MVNDVSGGQVFGSTENEAVVLDADGRAADVPRGSKAALAHAIWDRVVARFETALRHGLPRRLNSVPHRSTTLDARGTTTWLDAFSPPSP